MIIDSSALVVIILEEPDALACMTKLSKASSISISAVTLTEASMVLLSRGGQIKVDLLDAYLAQTVCRLYSPGKHLIDPVKGVTKLA